MFEIKRGRGLRSVSRETLVEVLERSFNFNIIVGYMGIIVVNCVSFILKNKK